MLAIDIATKKAAWIKNFDSSRLDGVPLTNLYRDILPEMADGSLLFGEQFQPTFLNKNYSCHVDAALEILYNLDNWRPGITSNIATNRFVVIPELLDYVHASIVAQDPPRRTKAVMANMAASMTAARDAVVEALSPITKFPVGEIGSCMVNLRTMLVWKGEPTEFGRFLLVGRCPNGMPVSLTRRNGSPLVWQFDLGWNIHVTPALMKTFCTARRNFLDPICPFEVLSGILSGGLPVRTVSKVCGCALCGGESVTIDCSVDVSAVSGAGAPLAPPLLLLECVDLDKSFVDYNASPFSGTRPLKNLSRLEGCLTFGRDNVHYTLIAVARHLGRSSRGGHWNCDVFPKKVGWFHAENLTGQSTSLPMFKDDKSCCGYLFVKT